MRFLIRKHHKFLTRLLILEVSVAVLVGKDLISGPFLVLVAIGLKHGYLLADLASQLDDILWHLVRRCGTNLAQSNHLCHLIFVL